MADLTQYTTPEFFIVPQDLPVGHNPLTAVSTYQAMKFAEAMKAIVEDMAEYRASIQSVGEGKYLRIRERQASILDGEGEWNLPPADEDHVGEDTA